MLAHDVFFTLKDASDDAVDRMLRSCHSLLSGHPGMEFFAAGVPAREFDRDVNDKDFHVSLHLVFTDKQAHDTYRDSERHVQFVAENKDNWQKIRVFDAYVES